MSKQLQLAVVALENQELLNKLAEEARIDNLEQRVFELKKRVDALHRPKVNIKLRVAIHAAVVEGRL